MSSIFSDRIFFYLCLMISTFLVGIYQETYELIYVFVIMLGLWPGILEIDLLEGRK